MAKEPKSEEDVDLGDVLYAELKKLVAACKGKDVVKVSQVAPLVDAAVAFYEYALERELRQGEDSLEQLAEWVEKADLKKSDELKTAEKQYKGLLQKIRVKLAKLEANKENLKLA